MASFLSDELKDKIKGLTPQQQRAIPAIVSAEARGIPLARLLKSVYSCKHCGRVIGRSPDSHAARQAAMVAHEAACDHSPGTWGFVANEATYYGEWTKQESFVTALAAAREEMTEAALSEASHLLRIGTVEAVKELLRQIVEAERDTDRARAAVALLDRASALTARKGKIEIADERKGQQNEKVAGLLDRLREAGD